MSGHARILFLTLASSSLAGCLGPLPHPVTLADFGQVEVGAAVQTLSAGLQFDGLAQVGVLPHLQLEAQAGIDIWAQWQVQAGLRGELPLGDENGIQLAARYDHQYYYSVSCGSDVAVFGGGNPACPPVSLNAGGFELGWAHEFGGRGFGSWRRRPALGLFIEFLGGQGRENGGTGKLILMQARIAAELPQGNDGFVWILGLGATALVGADGQFSDNAFATNPLSSLVFGVGMLFGT